MKCAEFVPLSYDTIEERPQEHFYNGTRRTDHEIKLNLAQYKERQKIHEENELIKFEKRKEELFEKLNSMTKENLLKEIVHFNCLIENDIKALKSCDHEELFMYNYHTNTRNWLTQLYLFEKKPNGADQSHDLLGINENINEDLLDAEIHVSS